MKVSEFMNQCFPKHSYHDALIKMVGDWEILENKVIKLLIRDVDEFELIFFLLEKESSEGDRQYMYAGVYYLGILINIPGDYAFEKWKYDKAIKGVEETTMKIAKEKREASSVN